MSSVMTRRNRTGKWEKARLRCNAANCNERWQSEAYRPIYPEAAMDAALTAFEQGWRIALGDKVKGAKTLTACPKHAAGLLARDGFRDISTPLEGSRARADHRKHVAESRMRGKK